MEKLPLRLKELRSEKNVSQKDVAKYIDVTPSAYGFYEQGKRKPTNDILFKLSEYYNVSIDYLLGSTNIKNIDYLVNNKLIQSITRVNRSNYSDKTTYEHIINQIHTTKITDLNKDDLVMVIQDMIGKIESTDVLKDLFLFVYMYLERYDYLDKEKDKYIILLRNTLIHMSLSDGQIQELINIYKSTK